MTPMLGRRPPYRLHEELCQGSLGCYTRTRASKHGAGISSSGVLMGYKAVEVEQGRIAVHGLVRTCFEIDSDAACA